MDIVKTHRFWFRRAGLNNRVWEEPHIQYLRIIKQKKPLRWHLKGLRL